MSINHENQYKNERESRWELAKENEYNAIKKIVIILKFYYQDGKAMRYDDSWFQFYDLDTLEEENWVRGVSDFLIALNNQQGVYAEIKIKQQYFMKTKTGGVTKLGAWIANYGCYSVYLDIHPVYQNISNFIRVFGLKKSSFIFFFVMLENNQFTDIYFINMEELDNLLANGFKGQQITVYGEGYGMKTKEGRANCYLIPVDAMHKFESSENIVQYFNECSSSAIIYPVDILKKLYK